MGNFILLTPEQKVYLNEGARPDEIFFVQKAQPKMTAWGWDGLFRKVSWDCGFHSCILLWVVRWYRIEQGGAKCDGSRTLRWNARWPGYVMAQTRKEELSVRFTFKTPDRERWNNQGGI